MGIGSNNSTANFSKRTFERRKKQGSQELGEKDFFQLVVTLVMAKTLGGISKCLSNTCHRVSAPRKSPQQPIQCGSFQSMKTLAERTAVCCTQSFLRNRKGRLKKHKRHSRQGFICRAIARSTVEVIVRVLPIFNPFWKKFQNPN